MNAILIPADLNQKIRGVDNDGTPESLRRAIGGGYVEVQRVRRGILACIDADGLDMELAVNLRATRLLAPRLGHGHYVAGDCLLIRELGELWEGRSSGLPVTAADIIEETASAYQDRVMPWGIVGDAVERFSVTREPYPWEIDGAARGC